MGNGVKEGGEEEFLLRSTKGKRANCSILGRGIAIATEKGEKDSLTWGGRPVLRGRREEGTALHQK